MGIEKTHNQPEDKSKKKQRKEAYGDVEIKIFFMRRLFVLTHSAGLKNKGRIRIHDRAGCSEAGNPTCQTDPARNSRAAVKTAQRSGYSVRAGNLFWPDLR